MQNAFHQPQTVLVLGGTSDIAFALTRQLIAERCNEVVLAGRDAAALQKNAEKLRLAGATRVETVVFDAIDTDNVTATVEQCFLALGSVIDLVIVAVGALGDQETNENDPSATVDLFTVNVTWPVAALAALRTKLIDQGTGRVLVLSSVAGVRIRRANYTYGATKAALDAYAQGYAASFSGTGIAVQIARLGFVRSKMTKGITEAPFAVDIGQAAAEIREGLTTNKEVLWVPGKLQKVFLLLTHLPTFLWRRLPG